MVKNGNDIIVSLLILASYSTVTLNTELKGENLIRITVKLNKCMILSKGIWTLISPEKMENVFCILKIHKKTLVSFITIHRKT